MKTKFMVLATVFLWADLALSEISVGITAEWLSHQSTLIAMATPQAVENIKGPGQVWFTKTRFRLDEVVKGPQTAGDTATVFDFSYNKKDVLDLAEAIKKKRVLLIFCSVAEHKFKEIDGRYIFTETHMFKSAYYQDSPVKKLYTPDFHFLSDFDALLKRTRSQVAHQADLLRRYWRGTIKKKALDIPFDSEIHQSLYAGSASYLWVPEYQEP